MQDGKALQAGTSHYLGQNFSEAMEIEFTDEDGERKLCYTTSWGVSTRMIGAVVMTHGDDDGLRLPPRMAPQQVVDRADRCGTIRRAVLEAAGELQAELGRTVVDGEPLRAEVDARDRKPAEKRWEWIRKGVPVDDRARRARHRAGRGDDDPPRRPRASAATRFRATAPPRRSSACSATFSWASSRRPASACASEPARTSPRSRSSASSSPERTPIPADSSGRPGARTRRPRRRWASSASASAASLSMLSCRRTRAA